MKPFKFILIVVFTFSFLSSVGYSQEKDLKMNEYYIDQANGYVSIFQKYSSQKMMREYIEKFKTEKAFFVFSFDGQKIERTKPDKTEVDSSDLKVIYTYKFPEIKEIGTLKNVKLTLKIDDTNLDFIENYTEPVKFNIDMKPALDKDKPQRLDFSIDRNFELHYSKGTSGQLKFSAKGYFSSKPDSNSLNSIKLNFGYDYLFTNAGAFKFFGLSGKIGTEHPQDFKQTNLTGSVVLSGIVPYTGEFARMLTGNDEDASYGIILNPEVQFVKNTKYADSNSIRFALHGGWDIPILKGQYLKLYGVAYYQNGYKPRSFIEATIEQKLSANTFLIAKWVNGELPPLFKKESDFSVGLRIQ